MTTPEFDQHAKQYDRLLADAMPPGMQENAYFAEYKVALMARRLRDRVPQRILDFGCGAGRSLTYLERYFPQSRIWGYDVSTESLEVASARASRSTLLSNREEMRSLQFDAIFAANVFHHIPRDDRALELTRCRDQLAPNGSMLLFEHNPYNPLTRWVFERCPFDEGAEMLTLRTALQLARQANFSSWNHGYTLFFPRPLAGLRGLEPLLRRVPLGAQYYVHMAR